MKFKYCTTNSLFSLLIIFYFGFSVELFAQDQFKFITGNISIKEGGVTKLTNSCIGGLNTPQFGTIDLNNDNVLDLVIFDASQNKYYTFINNGNATNSFTYTPYYENSLPEFHQVMVIKDFDRDGKKDIMGSNNVQDLIIYKNITTSTDKTPKFQRLYNHYYLNLYFGSDVYNPLTSRSSDYPIIGDMDKDGDLDIIKYEAGFGTIGYYVNKEVEYGYTGGDSMLLEYSDICWGSFNENSTENKINVGSCGSHKKYRHLGGSALLEYDFDNDGDVDIIMSNSTFNDVIYIENGKNDFSYPYDTAISSNKNFPPSSPINLASYPHLFLEDLNNDGKLDLIAASGGTEGYKDINQVHVYYNSGTNALPIFDAPNKNYMMEQTFDLGTHSSPALWDMDNDGDLDLFIAATGDFVSTGHTADRVFCFKNNGGVFELIDSDYAGLSSKGYLDLTITFGDVNYDGKKDLVYGLRSGAVGWYENTGTLSVASFTERSILVQESNKTASAKPYLYDYTKDGKPDLFVGFFKGNITYYYNNGNNTFTNLADTFGQVFTNFLDEDFNPPTLSYEGYATPVIVDINNDDSPELITGSVNGKIKIYSIDKSNPKAKFEELTEGAYTAHNGDTVQYNYIGYNSIPAVGDINGDKTLDLIVGSKAGGIMVFNGIEANNLKTKNVKEVTIHNSGLKVYPNPTQDDIFINRKNYSGELNFEIIDVTGKTIQNQNAPSNSEIIQLNTSNISNGTYFLRCLDSNGNVLKVSKIIIVH